MKKKFRAITLISVAAGLISIASCKKEPEPVLVYNDYVVPIELM